MTKNIHTQAFHQIWPISR